MTRGIILRAATPPRRIGAGPDPFLVDVHDLETQIVRLAARYNVVSLTEVLDHLAEGRPLPANSVHLSIDDGFAGTLVAAELLARHRLPWTLFVTVDAVLDGHVPWFVRLADAIDSSTNVLDAAGTLHDLSDPAGKEQFRRAAVGAVRSAPEQDDVVARILGLRGMVRPEVTRWPFLCLDQLRELAAAGVTIGSHAASHVDLTRASDTRLEEEVSASGRLQRALGIRIRYFAYPHGRHDARVRRAVAIGHEAAVSGPSASARDSRFRVQRFDAGRDRADLDAAIHGARPRQSTRIMRTVTDRVAARQLALPAEPMVRIS